MDVLEKRRAVLNKKYQNCLAVFQRFFSIPKIVLTIAITLALFIVLKFSVYRNIFSWNIPFIVHHYVLWIVQKSQNKKQKKRRETLVIWGGYPQLRSISAIITIPFNTMIHIFNHPEEYLINDYEILGLSFFWCHLAYFFSSFSK
jgi:hypothetical protein